MTTITRRYRFCASHRLHSDRLSTSENERIFGKCNNPYGHGHDYVLDVGVSGKTDAISGLVVRIADLDRLVNEEVLSKFAYRNLSAGVADFAALVPTTENLALVITSRLSNRWQQYFPHAGAFLARISIQETDRNSFEVLVPQAGDSESFRKELIESVIVNA